MSDVAPAIQRASERDLDDVADLDAAALGHGWSRDTWAAYLDRDNATFLVVIEPETTAVIGYACFRMVADEAELLRVAVATTHRRRGWARALLRAGHSCLEREGVRTVHLEVRHDQVAAIALYRAEGFRVVGRRPRYYREPMADAVLMSTTLSRMPSDPRSDPQG